MQKDNTLLSAMVNYYQDVKEQLSKARTCAVCGQAFVNLWLDCVRFELPKKASLLYLMQCLQSALPWHAGNLIRELLQYGVSYLARSCCLCVIRTIIG